MKLLFFILILSSCSLKPDYKYAKIEYCERINGVIYCDNGDRIDTNYYPNCSVYDTKECEE